MSKFQVGDDVRHKSHGWRGEVTDTTAATIRVASGGTERWYDAHLFEHDDPHVPDVDGRPIRVGQLVEQVHDAKRVGWAKWVADHHPNYPGFAERPHVGVQFDDFTDPIPINASHLRLVSLTFRPSEPDTRDVTLRVTVGAMPQILDNGVAETVRELLYQHGDGGLVDWGTVTVEVVDDGGHDDG